ncbi:hypothetical protein [Pollutimonas sp. M17]|uniref:hypothetical protein n=1 Tax=Pollutimonas sp. M17 TaxID=2962065 RepID=UPI0021F3E8E5|nr:hypothetical protein [Pollutimonas sp. M17]UYO94332.1 hypothetical protein OEG81_03080 [Pollutimonas sp. M17]
MIIIITFMIAQVSGIKHCAHRTSAHLISKRQVLRGREHRHHHREPFPVHTRNETRRSATNCCDSLGGVQRGKLRSSQSSIGIQGVAADYSHIRLIPHYLP